VDLSELQEQIRQRDHRDSTRDNSPLRKAKDAILVDTTSLSISEVVHRLLSLIKEDSSDVQVFRCHH